MNKRRVVITGVGPVSAIGIGRDAFWDGLAAGRSGIAEITAFDPEPYGSRLAAEITGFHVEDYLESAKTYLDRGAELAFAAMSLALEDAGLAPDAVRGKGLGICFGSALGSQETTRLFFQDFLAKGPRLVKPVLFPNTYANTAVSLLAIEYTLDGPHLQFSSGAVASAQAIIAATDLVQAGKSDLVFAGGYDAFSEVALAGYDRLGVLSKHNRGNERCAPFARGRDGFVLGEAAGIVVLEELEHAKARGARVYGEIRGAGLAAGPAFAAMPPPVDNSILRAMALALTNATLRATEITMVSASANGSAVPDRAEALALGQLFVDSATPVAVTSLKPLTGETLGASGVLQLCAALHALESGFVPPVLHLAEPDPAPGPGIRFVTPPGLRSSQNHILISNVDPGGNCVSLIVSACG